MADSWIYDKAYLIAPDKRGGKPYALLAEAMRQSGRCALAKWAWKSKQYVVQVRPVEDGLVLQQLLYADEVRSLKDLDIEAVTVTPAELQLALQLIAQISEEAYDPKQHADEEKKRTHHAKLSTRRGRAQIGGCTIVGGTCETDQVMKSLSAHLLGRSADRFMGVFADTVNDPNSTRKVYLLAGALALLGLLLIAITVWFWHSTRHDPALLAPLETMGQRRFRTLDGGAQQQVLDSARPPDAKPMRWGVVRGEVNVEPEIDLRAIDPRHLSATRICATQLPDRLPRWTPLVIQPPPQGTPLVIQPPPRRTPFPEQMILRSKNR